MDHKIFNILSASGDIGNPPIVIISVPGDAENLQIMINLNIRLQYLFMATGYNIFSRAGRPGLYSRSTVKTSKSLILMNMQPDSRPCRRQQKLKKQGDSTNRAQ